MVSVEKEASEKKNSFSEDKYNLKETTFKFVFNFSIFTPIANVENLFKNLSIIAFIALQFT